ncbi:UNVERIFIED_CONTAM: Heat shock factor-binding protein [Sesamum radiatum]|uniref:Heat shock factor-binding protein n=1 Tax=Sesamum radiatum TaxID=300843 RepID=A0AAW2LE64_SESRA
MTAFVQNLLQQMMGNRIDELEQSINDLRAEMGQEGSASPSAPLKTREDPKSAEDS